MAEKNPYFKIVEQLPRDEEDAIRPELRAGPIIPGRPGRGLERAAFKVLSSTPADEAAKTLKLAEERNLPLDVVGRNQEEILKEQDADLYLQLLQQSGATGEFLSNPANLAVAHDDLENLSIFENLAALIGERSAQLAGNFLRTVGTTRAEFDEFMETTFLAGKIEIDVTGRRPVIQWRPLTEEEQFAESVEGKPTLKLARTLEDITLGYTEMTSWEEFKESPLINFVPFFLEKGIGSLPDMAVFMFSLSLYAIARTGEIAQTRANANGKADATVGDLLFAAPFALASAWLDRFGARKIFGIGSGSIIKAGKKALLLEIVKTIGRETGKRATIEAGTEAAQEFIEAGGETLGTPGGFNLADAMERALQGAVVGLGFGGTVAVATTTVQATNETLATKRALDQLSKAAQESKLTKRAPAAAASVQANVLRFHGIEEVLISAEVALKYAQGHPAGVGPSLEALGVVNQMSEALEADGDVTISPEAFVENILGTPGYQLLANDMRFKSDQSTVTQAVITLADKSDLLFKALEADTAVPANLKERTQALIQTLATGDPATGATELNKAPPDVMKVLDQLLAKTETATAALTEAAIEGRVQALDERLATLDNQIDELTEQVEAREAGGPFSSLAEETGPEAGKATVALQRRLTKLTAERDALAEEQATLLVRPVRDVGAPSEALATVPKAVVTEIKTLEERVEKLVQQKRFEDELLERATLAGNKALANRIRRQRTASNKELAQTREALVTARKKVPSKRRQKGKKLSLRARVLDRLNVKTTRDVIRATRAGFRAGLITGRKNTKAAQTALIKMLEKSGLPAKDFKKFRRTIKNIETFEQLQTRLPSIQTRVMKLLDAARRRALLIAFADLVKKTKPRIVSGKPVGKLAPETQEVFEKVRKTLKLPVKVAQDKLLAALKTGESNPFDNQLLAVASRDKNLSTDDMETLLVNLERIRTEAAGVAKTLLEARQAETFKTQEVASRATTQNQDIDLEDTTKLTARIRASARNTKSQITSAWDAWNEITDKVFNKKIVDDVTTQEELDTLIEALTTENYITDQKAILIRWNAAFEAMAMEAYSVTRKWKLESLLHGHADRIPLNNGVPFENLAKKKVLLQYSKAQAMDFWAKMQNEETAAAYQHEEIGAFSQEMKDAVEDMLEPEDKVYAQGIMDLYDNMLHPEVNIVFREQNGLNFPKIKNYSPIVRDRGGKPIEEINRGGQSSDTFFNDMFVRATIPSAIKSRKPNMLPFAQQDITGAFIRQMHDLSHYIATAKHSRFLNSVFSPNTPNGARLRKEIAKRHGSNMVSQIDAHLFTYNSGYLELGRLAGITAFNQVFAKAVLAIKGVIGLKQLTSYFAMADDVPLDQFVAGSVEFAERPHFWVRFFYERSPLLQRRSPSIDLEFARLGAAEEALRIFRRRQSLDNALMISIRLGDRAPIYVGGTAAYLYAIKPKSKGGRGWSEAKAMRQFESKVSNTQQSRDLDKLSILQGHAGDFGKTIALFMTSRVALFRSTMKAIRQRPRWLGGRGKISTAEFAKRMLLYWIVMPSLIQLIANGMKFDPERQLIAAFLGQFNNVIVMGDIIMNATLYVFGLKNWKSQTNIPLFEWVDNSIRALADLVEAGVDWDQEEVLDAIANIADEAGKVTGFPVEQGRNAIVGAMELSDKDTREAGAKRIFGWSERVAKESSR